MCHCLWLCIESYRIATHPLSSLRKLQLAVWAYRLGEELIFTESATRQSSCHKAFFLKYHPKYPSQMPRYFLGRIWRGDCDKAFGADLNHLTLLLLCQVGFVHWCIAKRGPSCPADAQPITTPNALYSASLASFAPWHSLSGCTLPPPLCAVLEGVNTAVCLLTGS